MSIQYHRLFIIQVLYPTIDEDTIFDSDRLSSSNTPPNVNGDGGGGGGIHICDIASFVNLFLEDRVSKTHTQTHIQLDAPTITVSKSSGGSSNVSSGGGGAAGTAGGSSSSSSSSGGGSSGGRKVAATRTRDARSNSNARRSAPSSSSSLAPEISYCNGYDYVFVSLNR
jgi:hypothetical protein